MSGHLFSNGFARPWPEGQPRQQGERCELSDLLVSQCACRIHKKEEDNGEGSTETSDHPGPQDLDFS